MAEVDGEGDDGRGRLLRGDPRGRRPLKRWQARWRPGPGERGQAEDQREQGEGKGVRLKGGQSRPPRAWTLGVGLPADARPIQVMSSRDVRTSYFTVSLK